MKRTCGTWSIFLMENMKRCYAAWSVILMDHMFFCPIRAKKKPAATGGEAKDFSGFCAGFSDRPKKNHKAIIILLTEDFSMVWRKRQNKNGKRLRFPCRNSPTLECAVPSSWRASGQKKSWFRDFCTDQEIFRQKKSRHRTTLPHSNVQYHRR